jgi:hypothetical protein
VPGIISRRDGRNWDGSDPFGQTILLTAEGGLGDTLQFVRYVPALARLGARIILECQSELQRALSRVEGIWRIAPVGGDVPGYDLHCPLTSVPAFLGASAGDLGRQVPYLRPDAQDVERWRPSLQKVEGVRVGVNWQGSQAQVHRRNRSFPPTELDRLAQIPRVRLISLQKGSGVPPAPPMLQLPTLDQGSGAFVDTAAVTSQLDLVITCDTSLAHLAGAMGVPVWVALPWAADWRWMLDRSDSPWYPSMRLFRQTEPDKWGPLFESMADELQRRQS